MDPEKQEGQGTHDRAHVERRGTVQVVLTRSIILGGEHAEEGSTHEVSRRTAHDLISSGSAILADGEEPIAAATTVTRMETPVNADPKSRQVAPAPAKVKHGDKKK